MDKRELLYTRLEEWFQRPPGRERNLWARSVNDLEFAAIVFKVDMTETITRHSGWTGWELKDGLPRPSLLTRFQGSGVGQCSWRENEDGTGTWVAHTSPKPTDGREYGWYCRHRSEGFRWYPKWEDEVSDDLLTVTEYRRGMFDWIRYSRPSTLAEQREAKRIRDVAEFKRRKREEEQARADHESIMIKIRNSRLGGHFAGIAAGDQGAIKARYRALCREHHPDRGGDVAIMAAVNVEYGRLCT